MTVEHIGSLKIQRTTQGWEECYSTDVPEYGIVTCWDPRWELDNVPWTIYSSLTATKYSCADFDDVADCTLSTSSADFPHLNSTVKTDDNTIILTGTGFQFQTGYTASVEFASVTADTVTIDSDTQATAVFNWGVPLGSDTPKITF